MNPAEAVTFAEGIAQYYPMFIEDPIPPDNYQVLADVSSKTTVPFATGERFFNIQEFEFLLTKNGARYIRPDVCLLGGLTAAKKVASIAEAHYVGVVPHNPLGPVSTAACLQLDACIPNFTIQEFPSFYDRDNESAMMVKPFEVMDGCIMIPDAPGIGIELIPDIEEVFPSEDSRQIFFANTAFDGSVRDI
jgi:galactonate dehydratase